MEDEKILNGFPVITEEDVRRINAIFKPYVFYTTTRNGGRDCECSACNQKFHMARLVRTETPERSRFTMARHNWKAACPMCGQTVTLKNKGTCKSGANLEEWVRVVLLHALDGEIYAQAGYVRKRYTPGDWRPEAEVMPKAMYIFRPGEAVGWRWRHDYTFLGMTLAGHPIKEGWEKMKTVCEPWQSKGYSGFSGYFWNGYHVIGQERLGDSFLRYCAPAFAEWSEVPPGDGGEHYAYIRLLAAAATHPQIEMLLKMGLGQIVDELVVGKKKLTREIKWAEKDPRKAFGLTGPELKDFRSVNGSVELLGWYKRLRKADVRTDFKELERVAGIIPGGLEDRFFRVCAMGCGVNPTKAMEYVRGKGGKEYICWDSVVLWADYVEAAKYCGYDLDKSLVLMPKQLKEAHDGAVETELRLRHENEIADDSPFQRRFQKLMERYGFSDGEFFIRAPSSSREIILEGKYLNHCVGRYAGAHASGRTTILFMRREKEPFCPAWTIEIKGDQLIQVQGAYDRDSNKPKGAAEAFLRRWEAWVKAGSRRDKAREAPQGGAFSAKAAAGGPTGRPVENDMEGAKTA